LINQPDQEGWTIHFKALVLKWAIALHSRLHSHSFTQIKMLRAVSLSSHAVGLCVS